MHTVVRYCAGASGKSRFTSPSPRACALLETFKFYSLHLIILPYRRPIVVVWSNESLTAKFRGPLRIAIAPFVLVSI